MWSELESGFHLLPWRGSVHKLHSGVDPSLRQWGQSLNCVLLSHWLQAGPGKDMNADGITFQAKRFPSDRIHDQGLNDQQINREIFSSVTGLLTFQLNQLLP